MSFSDDRNTEYIYFRYVKKFKVKWKCRCCGADNVADGLREAFCTHCHARFNLYDQLGDIKPEVNENV